MTEQDEITNLILQSEQSFNLIKDRADKNFKQRADITNEFVRLMQGACKKYYRLLQELLRHPRRDNIAGCDACFRLSWLHNVYLSAEKHCDGMTFTVWYRDLSLPFYHDGWASSTSCTLRPGVDNFELLTLTAETGKPFPYVSHCSTKEIRKMNYFLKHYSDRWLYKAATKELRKRIKEKEYNALLLSNG